MKHESGEGWWGGVVWCVCAPSNEAPSLPRLPHFPPPLPGAEGPGHHCPVNGITFATFPAWQGDPGLWVMSLFSADHLSLNGYLPKRRAREV